MTEKLLALLFFGVLLALTCHFCINLLDQHYFATSSAFTRYWYVPFALVPGSLLALLGWWLGFFRRAGWADAVALLIVVGLAFLTIPASYSCGSGCF